jgi:hypothetical protein
MCLLYHLLSSVVLLYCFCLVGHVAGSSSLRNRSNPILYLAPAMDPQSFIKNIITGHSNFTNIHVPSIHNGVSIFQLSTGSTAQPDRTTVASSISRRTRIQVSLPNMSGTASCARIATIDILSLFILYVPLNLTPFVCTVRRLDALEREQEEFVERLTIQVLPTPPEPIGIAGRTDTGADADGKDNAPEPPLVDLTALPATLLFWDKHRETVNRLRDVREGIDTYQPPDRPLVYKGRMSLESMESATSSFSLDSPTSRTG